MNYEGEIKEIHLVERLIQLWREHFTGAIRFENDGIIKIVYFKEGDILSASTNDRADSVDEILMRAGKVSKEHVKQALAKRKENETLGDALLNLGFITRKELTWARRIQVINVIRSIEAWSTGSFTIVADYLPKREEGTIFPLPQLVVEMIVTDQDRGKFEKVLESGMAIFEKAPEQEETFRKLGLNEDAEAVMGQVDGERSASEVAAASRQETFNAFKLLHALAMLGILRRREGPPPATAMGFEAAGVSDAADVWGGDDSSSQFTLGDEPAAMSSFSSSDDMAPVPGLADPAMAEETPALPDEPPPPGSPPATAWPAWDEPPREATPIAAPAPEPPAEPAEEPRWGFDEAQIETAQKAVEPPPAPPPPVERARPRAPGAEGTMTRRSRVTAAPPVKKAPRYGLLVALMVIFILAAAGFYGYTWWQGRESGAVPAVESAPAPSTTTTAEAEAAAPLVATTTTVAPQPVGEVARPPQTQPPAATRPAPGGSDRARYETMAREYAANPRGSFTVQFAIVCEPSNVTKALRGSGGNEVWFIPITLQERSCFRMFWGGFATRGDAERGLSQLPGELRESRPAVVSVPR
ncbi:MAG TPA: DUF4388 domain-containing protein [Thermoanaerobaculia bacterium]|nr:DUF4388 domain-containing protein [Thermoanaerobaculia bacterium]